MDTYLEMIKLKTAVLFAYASRLGAYLVDGGNDQVKALSAYGLALGMAFQIRDDLLPYDSTSEAAGKDASSDLRNHRPTLPILLAYAHATPHQQDELHALWNDTDHERALPALLRVLQGTQAMVRARNLATTYGEQAQSHLDRLPDTPTGLDCDISCARPHNESTDSESRWTVSRTRRSTKHADSHGLGRVPATVVHTTGGSPTMRQEPQRCPLPQLCSPHGDRAGDTSFRPGHRCRSRTVYAPGSHEVRGMAWKTTVKPPG